ncbi:uncharacterized protein F4822DRAFT_297484 [Hypoxylon trugodes]|uniref:uncharacterized protein n=1 Tax=Hypoxylon trugodes TaxID=326681 RepID=UPI00219F4DC6|nr:uncharacterized protein F4822DRAFT_297484 [Hypoxylon trugodes]KAI1387966.1 hypothetical protein F4822DRAFT_297484 [Hypoxylon trugodes]
MNWHRGHTTTATEPAVVKPEGAGKKLRRKLQKIGTQPRWYKSNHDSSKTNHKNEDDTKKAVKSKINVSAISKPIPETADPNDGKWLEQLRKSGYLVRSQPPPVQQNSGKPFRHSMQVIPEFAHLSVNDAKAGRQLDKRASCATPSSTSTSTTSVTRRYAKTPVYHIGQLEDRQRREQQAAAHRVSSVEKIAESYRALLESSCAILNENEQPLRLGDAYRRRHDAKVHAYVDNRRNTIQIIPELSPQSTGTPHSDDGTLVAFEEEPVYTKPGSSPVPISISPSPSPPPIPPARELRHRQLVPALAPLSTPPRRQSQYQPEPEPEPEPETDLESILSPPSRRASPGSPGLQICLDLLGRELSSAASGSFMRPSSETSALQVWVMIEAYERLRDKLGDMQMDAGQERSLNTMLDTWIKALYAVHDKMTGGDGRGSESDYGD